MKITALMTVAFALFASSSALASTDECEFIRKAIHSLPAAGGEYTIPVGTYNCKAPIVIDRSNVVLRGASKSGTVIRLADHVHAPLLIIGNKETFKNQWGAYVTSHRVENVLVSDMTFDGNRANHDTTKECGEGICEGDPNAVRNNGITIRGSSHIKIKNVVAHSTISGGMVTEKYCDNLVVDGFESYNNFFDGFAGYETTNSTFNNFYLHNNLGAGLSLDLNFNDNVFNNTQIIDTKDVGIFARFISGNRFNNLNIVRPGSYGVFLAKSEAPDSCAINNDFTNSNINYSAKAGIRNNDDCGGNRIYGKSNLCANAEAGISESRRGSLVVGKNVACAK